MRPARLALALVLAVPAWAGTSLGGALAFAKDGGQGGGGSGHGGSGSGDHGGNSGHGRSGSSGRGGDSSGKGSSGSSRDASSGESRGTSGREGRGRGADDSGSDRSRTASGGGRDAVVWSSDARGGVEIRYGDGWSEGVEGARYTLRDPARRVVASRPARRDDLSRLRALAD